MSPAQEEKPTRARPTRALTNVPTAMIEEYESWAKTLGVPVQRVVREMLIEGFALRKARNGQPLPLPQDPA